MCVASGRLAKFSYYESGGYRLVTVFLLKIITGVIMVTEWVGFRIITEVILTGVIRIVWVASMPTPPEPSVPRGGGDYYNW